MAPILVYYEMDFIKRDDKKQARVGGQEEWPLSLSTMAMFCP